MVEIQARTTDDILDIVESMCGYTPEQVVTAVVAEPDNQPHLLVVPVSKEEHISPAVASLMGHRDSTIAVVVWGDEDTAFMTSAIMAYAVLSNPEVPILRATAGEWWWLTEVERHGRQPSQARMEMIYAGVDAGVAPNREAMFSHQLLFEPRWGELERKFPPVPPDLGGVWVVGTLLKREPLNRDETAMVIGALQLGSVRDYVAEALARSRLERRLEDLDTMRARMVETVAEACDHDRAFLYRAIGMAFYLMGSPETAEKAVLLAQDSHSDPVLTEALLCLMHDNTPDEFADVLIVACDASKEANENE